MSLNAGTFERIYDPSPDAGEPTYINDHCLVRAGDGELHLFGITHAEPADPQHEVIFAHATAPEPRGPWRTQKPALRVDTDYGETHLWAPHVIRHDGRYWMFYAGGGPDATQSAINLATSTDLYTWTRNPDGPLFRDGFGARDPMVLRTGREWTMYYCATTEPTGGHHVVAYRTSTDLVNWHDRSIAFTSKRSGKGDNSNTESPFVTEHDGHFYLFVGPCGGYSDGPDGYSCTAVYRSHDPHRFPRERLVTKLTSHAAEVVDDNRYVTHAGWGQGGVWLAPLYWD